MMALEKYKICPVCGEHNSPSLLECRKCKADLTGVKVTDSALEQQEKKEEEPVSDMTLFLYPKGMNSLLPNWATT